MSTKLGRISQLDGSTLLRIQAGCNFVNAEVARLRTGVIRIIVVVTTVALIVFALMVRSGNSDPRFPLFAAFAIIAFFIDRARRELKKTYKGIVVKRVVDALGHGLTYKPVSTLTKLDFNDMHLFDHDAEHWTAEDEVCGKKNAVTYSLHEAHAWYMRRSGKRRRRVTIFKGLIIRLDFNKNFVGHTVVVRDSQGQILGGLFGEFENRENKEIVRLENPEFEKLFSVYSTDQQQARYLLTPKLMELILQAQSVLGADLRLSFHDNSMFLTVPQSQDRFEANLFGGTVTPESTLGDFVEVVSLAERLVDTLDLETRVWTRV